MSNYLCYLGLTHLHKTASHGYFDLVKSLLEAGANIEAQNDVG